MHDLIRPEPQRLSPLPLVFGNADDAPSVRELPQSRDDEETDASRPDHKRRLARSRSCSKRLMYGAGQRLYRHGRLVRHFSRDAVELGRMSDESPLRPTPARVAAEAGLDAGRDLPLCDVYAEGVAS